MNPIAYRTTGLFVRTVSSLSRARIHIHGREKIPDGAIIFVVNHFTRLETLLMPTCIFQMTHKPVWSLADFSLFRGALGRWLDAVGGVSTRSPHRDQLIVKTLLTGEAHWIIFPEGHMVKDKKIFDRGRYMLFYAGIRRPPHTGAATLALRTEFYRQRLAELHRTEPDEAQRIMTLFGIEDLAPVLGRKTYIMPVNLTYYPIRVRENILNTLADRLVKSVPERLKEEIMTEGTMLLSGVDIDIRMGEPIRAEDYLNRWVVEKDIASRQRFNFDDAIPSRKILRKMTVVLMRRYMAAIYGMTTVNHDHLFASVLRMYPLAAIDSFGWKRRVYLAASRNLENLEIHCHQGMTADQLHLLTDDGAGKFKDFVSVALDKKVLRKAGNRFVKDRRRLAGVSDFHRVRIDNTVAVIANEVEPLVKLQRLLRRLAWTPEGILRRSLARQLMKQARGEYETDYHTYFVPGESKAKPLGMPYLIRGRSRKMGVLLIHGYMAGPLEVKELACFLGQNGFWVYVPRLKGHATSPDDLSLRTYKDWIRSVDMGYAVVRNQCERVVVGGFSTGAGLALELATRIDDLAGVFAVCPPLRLQDFSARLVPAMDAWNRWMKRVQLDGIKKEFVENRPENPHINYARNPIAGVLELERLMEALESKLPGIKLPALVIQSASDPIVDPKGSRRLYERLGSENKRYELFSFRRHGILLGEGARQVHQSIGVFVRDLRGDSG